MSAASSPIPQLHRGRALATRVPQATSTGAMKRGTGRRNREKQMVAETSGARTTNEDPPPTLNDSSSSRWKETVYSGYLRLPQQRYSPDRSKSTSTVWALLPRHRVRGCSLFGACPRCGAVPATRLFLPPKGVRNRTVASCFLVVLARPKC